MRNHPVSQVSRTRGEHAATRLLHEFRRAPEDGSFIGGAIFAGIGLLAGLVAAISGVPGVWF